MGILFLAFLPDELQSLVDEWWSLLPEGEQISCPLIRHTAPKARRNLFWWVEEWLGDDLLRINTPQHNKCLHGKDNWSYQMFNVNSVYFDHPSRPIALMNAAIAVAERRKTQCNVKNG